MREKRQHLRTVLATPVQISQGEGPAWEVCSVDIGRGGMFLSGALMVAIGTEVTVNFELENLGMVSMPAFVRWKSADGFGVQFGLLGARETHAIGALVRRTSLHPKPQAE